MSSADVKEHRRQVEDAERRHATAVRQLGEALVEAATLRRQRDEAVKAFQRERAKVVRVEEVAHDYAKYPGWVEWGVPQRLRAAIADRSDAPQTPVHASGAPGQGSDAQGGSVVTDAARGRETANPAPVVGLYGAEWWAGRGQ